MKTIRQSSQIVLGLTIICSSVGFAQKSQDGPLEKMPPELETAFALSALPPHLRDQATVYLLDPKKGYFVGRQGTNGFVTFINRTQWEWAEFATDAYGAVSYDAEGAKTYLPVYFDVAAMRASGKYTPAQIRDIIIRRVNDGTYKAPSRTGVSYMLGPLNRSHVGDRGMVNDVIPHYMFYAPKVDNSDIGGQWDGHSPFAINSGDNLDKEHSIFNYIILPAGETEKAKIIEDNKDLLRRLVEYKPYFKIKIEPNGTHQHQ